MTFISKDIFFTLYQASLIYHLHLFLYSANIVNQILGQALDGQWRTTLPFSVAYTCVEEVEREEAGPLSNAHPGPGEVGLGRVLQGKSLCALKASRGFDLVWKMEDGISEPRPGKWGERVSSAEGRVSAKALGWTRAPQAGQCSQNLGTEGAGKVAGASWMAAEATRPLCRVTGKNRFRSKCLWDQIPTLSLIRYAT